MKKLIFVLAIVGLILLFAPSPEWKIMLIGLIGVICGSYLLGQLSQRPTIRHHQQQEIHHFQKRLSDNRWIEMQNEVKKK